MVKGVRVFLDSNVIISGLFSDRGAPCIILDILCLGLPVMRGMTGRYNLIEIERNLEKKMPAVLPIYKKYFPKMHLEIVPVPPVEEVRRFAGVLPAKDVPVLVSALLGKADFLITGDKKDFSRFRGMRKYRMAVVSPSEFVDTILPPLFQQLEHID
jgi:predicted nucleic acid-binding protein